MSDPAVTKLKLDGHVAVWTYGESRHYPGWHLCCDRSAGDNLLRLVDTMTTARFPAKKGISLVSDERLTKATGHGAKPRFASTLEVCFDRANDAAVWELEEHGGHLQLKLGINNLRAFRQGISDLMQGGGDYAIGEKPRLWFWWKVEQP